jgi:choline dehydrogenase-like flavoprotein
MVYEVDMRSDGRARGVSFIDRRSGAHHSVRARVVVLAASTCESARLLLNSRGPGFPNGLANASGQVGRNLLDSAVTRVMAQFPALEALPARQDDGLGGGSAGHLYVPWWGYGQKLDFPRGYHIEMVGGRKMPSVPTLSLLAAQSEATHGPGLREGLRRRFGSYYSFIANGEMLPNEHSYCEIDPHVKDRWGIPVLRFHWQWGEHEQAQARHMRKTLESLTEHLGGTLVADHSTPRERLLQDGGSNNHEVGTTRMGASPRDSVVNAFGQAWGIDNLFVMDGGVFPSNSDKNPTLTILALAWRNSAHLLERARRGEL